MAEENKNPTPPPTPFNEENVPPEVEATEDKTIRELRDVPVETVPDSKLPEPAEAVKYSETPAERETRREAEAELNKPIEAIEDAVNRLDKEDQAIATNMAHVLPHALTSNTELFGRTFPFPIYTLVYFTLFGLTVIEVIISLLPHGFLGNALLIGFSGVKIALVVAFYMHLREDSRMFLLALVLPLVIALVASLFLLTVPVRGY
jgi:caa(3)-type oxidase subunit IV